MVEVSLNIHGVKMTAERFPRLGEGRVRVEYGDTLGVYFPVKGVGEINGVREFFSTPVEFAEKVFEGFEGDVKKILIANFLALVKYALGLEDDVIALVKLGDRIVAYLYGTKVQEIRVRKVGGSVFEVHAGGGLVGRLKVYKKKRGVAVECEGEEEFVEAVRDLEYYYAKSIDVSPERFVFDAARAYLLSSVRKSCATSLR
ncbi:hypothetical protein [Pyrococcus kukulkanii]|uniref:hypothetical protein n=1 Tax=Pyrococcus kukulkanii TaxID=1609559 RepID=UPI00356AEC46